MAIQRGLLAALGVAATTLGAGAMMLGGRAKPDPNGLKPQFQSFLTNYVPAGAASTLWSYFARFTSAGRIDLFRTRSLSDLLHQMQQNLQKQQAADNKRYFEMMKAFRTGVQAWEKQQVVEARTRVRLADELKLSEQARDRLRQTAG